MRSAARAVPSWKLFLAALDSAVSYRRLSAWPRVNTESQGARMLAHVLNAQRVMGLRVPFESDFAIVKLPQVGLRRNNVAFEKSPAMDQLRLMTCCETKNNRVLGCSSRALTVGLYVPSTLTIQGKLSQRAALPHFPATTPRSVRIQVPKCSCLWVLSHSERYGAVSYDFLSPPAAVE